MRVQLIRNATLKLTYGGCTFLIDPAFGDPGSQPSIAGRAENPMVPLPLRIPDILQDVQLVLVSHLHRDHFDQAAADALSAHSLIFCQPGDEARLRAFGFSNVASIKDTIPFGRILVSRFDAMHGSGAVLGEMGRCAGFFFESENEPSLLWCGDSVLFPDLKRLMRTIQPNVVVIHACGAKWGKPARLIVMDAAQAIDVCKAVPNARVIATHMEAWDHATVSRDDLRAAADKAGISADHLIIPDDGGVIEVH